MTDRVLGEAEIEKMQTPLWEQAKGNYAMTAVRDCQTLCTLYAASDTHFTRLRVRRGGQDIGWAVVGRQDQLLAAGGLAVGLMWA